MKQEKIITILSISIATVAAIVASIGIFSNDGIKAYAYKSIRGEMIQIYGKGVYKHMSAEVAPQGIAQDYVTLFIGVPLLLMALVWAKKGSVKGRFLLAGTLSYFFVTYLFYLAMGMYNYLFLAYASLLGTTFFALTLTLLSFDIKNLPSLFSDKTPVKSTGGFLVFGAIAIAIMWLNIVVPPLLDGSIIPKEVAHYTTLIVQGLDLGLLHPLAVVSGLLLLKNTPFGYLMGPVYFIFLSLLMTALTAKVIGMGLLGYNIIPVIFIIPAFNLMSIGCSYVLLKNIIK